jgi:anti-sigma B factor antagonist
MNILIEERPDGIVSIAWGTPTVMDAACADELRATFSEVERKSSRIVLDMSQVEFIDSSIIGALVGLLRRVRAAGGDAKLAGVTPEVEMIFEVTRLHRVFRILPSVAAAVEDFAQQPS